MSKHEPLLEVVKEERTTYTASQTTEQKTELFVKVYMAIRTSGFLSSVSGNALKVLLAISTYINQNGEGWPTVSRLAQDTGLSDETVSKCISELEERKAIQVSRRKHSTDGQWASNSYMVTPNSGYFQFGNHRTGKQPSRKKPGTVSTGAGSGGGKQEPSYNKSQVVEQEPDSAKTKDAVPEAVLLEDKATSDSVEGKAPQPSAGRKKRAPAAPRTPTPEAIKWYRSIVGRYPLKALYHQVEQTLERRPRDGPLLRRCYESWLARGYNPRNMAWLTDWYVAGEIPKNGQKQPDGELSAILEGW